MPTGALIWVLRAETREGTRWWTAGGWGSFRSAATEYDFEWQATQARDHLESDMEIEAVREPPTGVLGRRVRRVERRA